MDCDRQPKPAWFAYRDALDAAGRQSADGSPGVLCRRADRAGGLGLQRPERCAAATPRCTTNSNATARRSRPARPPPRSRPWMPPTKARCASSPRRNASRRGHGPSGTAGRRRQGAARCVGRARRVSATGRSEVAAAFRVRRPDGQGGPTGQRLGRHSRSSPAPCEPGDAILIDDFHAFGKVEEEVAQAVAQGRYGPCSSICRRASITLVTTKWLWTLGATLGNTFCLPGDGASAGGRFPAG